MQLARALVTLGLLRCIRKACTSRRVSPPRGGHDQQGLHSPVCAQSRPRDDPGVPRPLGMRAGGRQTALPRRVA
eukprot:3747704-Prymnesium_polylepis.1